MRIIFPLLLIMIASCQAKLTEEQKKALREGMKASEIVKITEAEITSAAFTYGRKIADEVNKVDDPKKDKIDELQKQYNVTIFPLEPGDSLLLTIEQQLIEAYTAAKDVELTDNVQKIGKDSILYTSPIMITLPDGSLRFEYALGIKMPIKEVVLSIDKN